MSLNIRSDHTNATSMQGMARTFDAGGRLSKRPVPDHAPDAAGGIPKAGSPVEEPERLPLRAHPAASTEDPLQRLPESGEAGGKSKLRGKKGTAEQAPVLQSRMRCPYDPPPTRQRDLDVLA